MNFFFLAYLVSTAAALTCNIVGIGNGLCRSCPASGCDILQQIPNPGTGDFSCIWQQGENVLGDK